MLCVHFTLFLRLDYFDNEQQLRRQSLARHLPLKSTRADVEAIALALQTVDLPTLLSSDSTVDFKYFKLQMRREMQG